MTVIESIILSIGEAAALAQKENPNTHEKDGLLYCSICNQPLQAWVKCPVNLFGDGDTEEGNRMVLVPVRCQCAKDRARLAEEKAKQAEFERNTKELRKVVGNFDCTATFAKDNGELPEVTKLCKKYVSEFHVMRKENIGILFYGAKGTGKTFFAECIVNALEEAGIMTGFTTTSELILRMQGNEKEEILDAVRAFSVLVIDDLGAERNTTFGAESVYNVINARYRCGKPTIITSNLDLTDMKNEADLWRGRIYDRVIEMCPIAIEMAGESRRKKIAEDRKRIAKEILREE